jgi:hypothetical protein
MQVGRLFLLLLLLLCGDADDNLLFVCADDSQYVR